MTDAKELARRLSAAWIKYMKAFGGPPQGTEKQMAALIELAGGDALLSQPSAEPAVAAAPAQETGTPRTDAQVVDSFIADGGEPFVHKTDYWAMTEHARTLERKLAAAREELEHNRSVHETTLNDRERIRDLLGDAIERAEAAESRLAEVEKDSARYRWLRNEYGVAVVNEQTAKQETHYREHADAAIDAALAREAGEEK